MVKFPEPVWALVKAYSIRPCPECGGGGCYLDMFPCYLDQYSQLLPDNPLHGMSTREFRAYFFATPEEQRETLRRRAVEVEEHWEELSYSGSEEIDDDDRFFDGFS